MLKIPSGSTSCAPSLQSYVPTSESAQLLQAIKARDIVEVESLLRPQAISLTEEQQNDVLEEAWQDKRCPDVIRTALLQRFRPTHQSKLDLAVRYDDHLLAEESLQQGAVPKPEHFDSDNAYMRGLLLRARRKNILYPSASPTPKDPVTDLDLALRNGNYQQAHVCLRREVRGPVRKLWAAAVQQRRPDILRALLLLGYADRDPGFRLKEQSAEYKITGTAILQIMKEAPQYPPKSDPTINFNGELKNDKEETAWCRHFIENRHQKLARSPNINNKVKFTYW